MLLITSAFPHLKRFDEDGRNVGPDLVAQCVASWQANGFHVASVHNVAERDLIGDGLPGVEYRFIEEALPEGARRLPTMAAVLGDLPPDEPVGIVNADIYMARVPDLAARMAKCAREASLVLHRWDVPSLSRREGRRFEVGVDLFAFTPSRIAPAIEGLIRRPYQLGVPWWDYALPLASSLYGPLRLVSDTLLLHHLHDQAWNEEEWHSYAEISAGYLAEQTADDKADPELSQLIRDHFDKIEQFFASGETPKERHYAIAELTLHLINSISAARAVSLVAELSLPPDLLEQRPWMEQSALTRAREAVMEARLAAEAEAAARALAASAAEALEAKRHALGARRPEFDDHIPLKLETRITTKSSVGSVLYAGLRDIAKIICLTGKLIERRFRRWRRGAGLP